MSRAVLTLDTASPFCSVAVRIEDGTIFSLVSEGEGNHFEKLPDLVRELLVKAGIVISDVGTIGVGVGPGSFTGIRIGMSFSKGLAWARKVPLIGFCSLGACAVAAAASQGSRGGDSSAADTVAVISDAGRDELFFGVFLPHASRGGGFSIVAPTIIPRLELAQKLVGITKVVSPQSALLISGAVKEVLPQAVPVELVREPARGGLGIIESSGAKVASTPNTAECNFELDRQLLGRSLSATISLEPTYLRQVAAKTIAERMAPTTRK